MQAVILAGGLGTRLGDLTKSTPKPMVLVAGKPYLEHQLSVLKSQGIEQILLLTGYLSEVIEEHFEDGKRFGLSIQYAREESPQGTGGALRDAHSLLASEFLLIYGDSYLPIHYQEVLESLIATPNAMGVAVVYSNLESTSVPNNIAISGGGFISRYEKDVTGVPELKYVEAGVLAFRRDIVDFMPPSGSCSLEKDVFPQLIRNHSLKAFVTEQRFYDIGTPERLKIIEGLFSR